MKKYYVIVAIIIMLLSVLQAGSETLKSIEFKNQEMRDILFALAGLGDISVLPDDTVTGKTSFFFSSMDYDAAIRLFIESNNLFSWEGGGILYVSRIRVEQSPDTKLISVRCRDVSMKSLVQAIASIAGKTILFDQLPQEPVTLRADELDLRGILAILVAKYPDLSVDAKESYFYIRKKDPAAQATAKPGNGYFTKEKDLYSIEAERGRFRDLVLDLFEKGRQGSRLPHGSGRSHREPAFPW